MRGDRAVAGPVDLPLPGLAPVAGPAPAPGQVVVDWGGRHALWCTTLGLACCALEVLAATTGGPGLLPRPSAGVAARRVDVLVVSGTVTDKLAPAVLRTYEQLPEPRRVVSFGACANSGGPYWDSYCVTKGVDQLLPVDVWVPGCPPRPEALVQGLRRLHAQLEEPAGVGAGRP